MSYYWTFSSITFSSAMFSSSCTRRAKNRSMMRMMSRTWQVVERNQQIYNSIIKNLLLSRDFWVHCSLQVITCSLGWNGLEKFAPRRTIGVRIITCLFKWIRIIEWTSFAVSFRPIDRRSSLFSFRSTEGRSFVLSPLLELQMCVFPVMIGRRWIEWWFHFTLVLLDW